jgi:hypothetical protein
VFGRSKSTVKSVKTPGLASGEPVCGRVVFAAPPGDAVAATAVAGPRVRDVSISARQMAGLLGVDAIVDVKKLLEDEGVASGANGQADGANAAAAQ